VYVLGGTPVILNLPRVSVIALSGVPSRLTVAPGIAVNKFLSVTVPEIVPKPCPRTYRLQQIKGRRVRIFFIQNYQDITNKGMNGLK
jgi:hypothetical protein